MKHLPLFLATLPAALGAQNMTSPPGHLTADGGGVFDNVAGAYAGQHTHIVHVDDALRGSGAHSIRGVFLRRDASAATNPAYAARPLPVEIRMAQADFTKVINGGGHVPDATLRLTPWQTVFAQRMVSLPSFVTKPASALAPWSVSLLLDTPFAYQPTSALAIHLRISPNSNVPVAPYPIDATGESGYSHESGVLVGAGCQITGQPGPFWFESSLVNYGDVGSQSSLTCSVIRGVPSTPWILALGLSDPGISFGGCAALHTSAQVTLPQAATDAAGIGRASYTFAHHASLLGTTFWLQAAQPYANASAVPIALSNGRRTPYPANPVLPRHALALTWSSAPTFGVGHDFFKGATLVFGLDW
ncbi:MAG: hypothetical protein IPM13_18070 [Phycisphaerales bacterium]|nr:hypothetical protein [Phycisphaerales bacterium]